MRPADGTGDRLIVWLHGGGEGASLPDGYYDNETTLRANRGALGFATPEAQRIFSGAYVVAPPTWLVTSRDDATVPPEPNTIHAHDLIPGSLMTLYDHVVWDGHRFPGHWSWIYVARNEPTAGGTHIWQWMARQRR